MLWPTDAAFNALSEKRQKWLYRREHRDVLASYLKAHMIRDTKVKVTTNRPPPAYGYARVTLPNLLLLYNMQRINCLEKTQSCLSI